MTWFVSDERRLAALAWRLARTGKLAELTPQEQALLTDEDVPKLVTAEVVSLVREGVDPLGDTFCALRSAAVRRPDGAVYTPDAVVDVMVAWGQRQAPGRVVDPGAGSGRFLVAAGRALPKARLVGVETDPLAALVLRANLTAAGLDDRASVLVADYRTAPIEPFDGRTLFVGNPPYVRHHQIGVDGKSWLAENARRLGYKASKLAGLHVHFFLATLNHAAPGDVGAFITSAEWLDVNYGSLVRELLVNELGGLALHVIDPNVAVFEGTATTAAVTCFEVMSAAKSMRLRRVERMDDLAPLERGRAIRKERLTEATRWTPLLRTAPKVPDGYIELGEICRVHRGAVTGANNIWVTPPGSVDLPPQFLYPSVTKARELFAAGIRLEDPSGLRHVIDIPVDLELVDASDRKRVKRFLVEAKARGGADGYIARARRAWWSVGLRAPAPETVGFEPTVHRLRTTA